MSQSTLFPQQEYQNESKTENHVRKHFEKYESEIKIEEQRSDSPRIQKLLRSASKVGTGTGKPDFNFMKEYISRLEYSSNLKMEEREYQV